MADTTVGLVRADQVVVPVKYIDNGDGTYSLAVEVTGGELTAAGSLGNDAGENHIGQVGGEVIIAAAAQLTRPADTTAYAIGDLIANSTTVGLVVPLSFTVARVAAGSGMIRRCKIERSQPLLGASIRLHLYTSAPTPSNGDNGAYITNGRASYMGAMDVALDRVFTDGAAGYGIPRVGSEITFDLASGQTIRGLLEVLAVFTPGSGETFDVSLEVLQN